MSQNRDTLDPHHPHEPEIEPVYDDEGRCLVCKAIVAARDEGFESGFRRCEQVPTWHLTGDLEWLEFAISDYIVRWGQHLPGVEDYAGIPTAVANMAMTVIRKNIRRVEPPSRPPTSATPNDAPTETPHST
jgi:hypothetical protein